MIRLVVFFVYEIFMFCIECFVKLKWVLKNGMVFVLVVISFWGIVCIKGVDYKLVCCILINVFNVGLYWGRMF